MRVFAPGKLVLTGAYAVLEGAPAIVVATNRGAVADATRVALTATPEVRARSTARIRAAPPTPGAAASPTRPGRGTR